MPLRRLSTTGDTLIASASVEIHRVVIIPNQTESTLTDVALQVTNLPNAFFWIRQTAGLAGLSFTPMFAVDNTTSGAAIVPDWKPLTVPQPLFLGQPLYVNQRIVATMLTLNVQNPTGQPATLDIVVAASQ